MEESGVKQGAEQPVPGPLPGPQTQAFRMDPNTSRSGATDQTGASEEHPAVAYERFKEVNDEKNDLKAALQEQDQKHTAERQQLMSGMQEVLKTQQQQQVQSQDSAAAEKTVMDSVRSKFGPGEAGDQAAEAVIDTVEAILDARGVSNLDAGQIIRQTSEMVDNRFSQMNTTMAQNQRLQSWQQSGMYGAADVEKIQAHMRKLLEQDSRWASSMDRLAETANTQLMESGDIRPWTQPRRQPANTPLQPGPTPQPRDETKSQKLARIRQEVATFPSLSELSDDRLLELYGSEAPQEVQQSSDDPVSPELIHGAYHGAGR